MHKFIAKQKHELELLFIANLSWFLPPFLRLYHELRDQVQPSTKTTTIILDELASSLGYDVGVTQELLRDLSKVGVIEYKPNRDTHKSQTVTLLVL